MICCRNKQVLVQYFLAVGEHKMCCGFEQKENNQNNYCWNYVRDSV